MISAFGVEHGEPVEKGVIGGTGRFFQGLAGKKPAANIAPKPQTFAVGSDGSAALKANASDVTSSLGFNRGVKSRKWLQKNPLKTAGAAAGSGATLGVAAGAGRNEAYRRKYA